MSDDKKSETPKAQKAPSGPHATLDLKADRVAEEEPDGASRNGQPRLRQ